MSQTIVQVNYRSATTGTENSVDFLTEAYDDFQSYLDDIFAVCNGADTFEVRSDKCRTSLSIGDKIFVDIMGFLPQGVAKVLPVGWEIEQDPTTPIKW